MQQWWVILTVSLALGACGSESSNSTPIDPAKYQVKDHLELQQRIEQLNSKLATDFQQFKKLESLAFSDQHPLDVKDLTTLNLHLVASTALKPTKVAYCELMNDYFAQLYRLGHYNLAFIDQVQLPHRQNFTLSQTFQNPNAYYDFIMNRYSSYKQVQQVMKYGCNLKAALTPQS